MRFYNCSMFCCALIYVHSSFAVILMGKRESLLRCFVESCVALPRGVLSFSEVCDCDIS